MNYHRLFKNNDDGWQPNYAGQKKRHVTTSIAGHQKRVRILLVMLLNVESPRSIKIMKLFTIKIYAGAKHRCRRTGTDLMLEH